MTRPDIKMYDNTRKIISNWGTITNCISHGIGIDRPMTLGEWRKDFVFQHLLPPILGE
jgi:hypothetical protein